MSVTTVDDLARAHELLVALDFDGTLSPLNDEPMAARMVPAAREAVQALARLPHTTVALVSGRSLADLETISEHTADSRVHLAGSHGAEQWHPGGDDAPPAQTPEQLAERDRIRSGVAGAVQGLDGVWIEPKTFGFAVHTRLSDAAASRAAHERVESLMAREAPGWRRRTGLDILEYASRPEGKDIAVSQLRDRLHADAVLFAGDDVTDEDALRRLGPGDLGVHVGGGETAASVRVADIPELAALLLRLAHERALVAGARE